MSLNIHGDTAMHYNDGELVLADVENKDAWIKTETPMEASQ